MISFTINHHINNISNNTISGNNNIMQYYSIYYLSEGIIGLYGVNDCVLD